MNILFRSDASPKIGTGHVMRCLALAQALQKTDGQSVFITSKITPSLADRLKKNNCEVVALSATPYGQEDAEEVAKKAKDIGAQWIIVDGYSFDADYQQHLKEQNLKILFIDDYGHAKYYSSDIILNQNIYASDIFYKSREVSTKLLLGTRYALLRQEFVSAHKKRKIQDTASKILVTFGGADSENITGMVIEALRNLENVEVRVVVGGTNPHLKVLQDACNKASMEVVIDASNMHELMTWADLAITSGGTTCYELAYMGLPMMIMIISDNQKAVAEGIEAAGAGINLGHHTKISHHVLAKTLRQLLNNRSEREDMSSAGIRLVDGHGAARVCMEMFSNKIWLRPATSEDCKITFEWANDPQTRDASFSSDPIPWDTHAKWYQEKLSDLNHRFFIAYNEDDELVGQVRFDIEGDRAVISVSVAPDMRGKKYATELIANGCRRMFATTDTESIDAYIKPENEVSKAVFAKSGFTETAITKINGEPSLHLVLKSNMLKS
ncbi:UDP-2,4-diacetamido-2,4,6-trideoxy-beta-L-altropyranose hydrolase [Patescibacteria group bacterium]|nr:UDP-2,4-diacetamido-2,4,6-trideoxy-beta-L-altropyranose hydrolase [Patescibacteria group bacterium]